MIYFQPEIKDLESLSNCTSENRPVVIMVQMVEVN